MSKFTVTLKSPERCQIKHELAGAEIETDLPPEYGGQGRSFSSTDLVSAALGTCTITSIGKILEREGYDPKLLKIEISKELSQSPKMIKAIKLKVIHPKTFKEDLLKKLRKTTNSCPVKRSLNDHVEVDLEYITI
jgi:putative redox protein